MQVVEKINNLSAQLSSLQSSSRKADTDLTRRLIEDENSLRRLEAENDN